MFGLMAGLYNSYLAPQKISILLIGCDGAGKTALLERCKVTQFCDNKGVKKLHRLYHGTFVTHGNGGKCDVERKKKKKRNFCPGPAFYGPEATIADDDEEEGIVLNEVERDGAQEESSEESSIRQKEEEEDGEVDLRPGAKMLPLHKLTSTVGMNLAKFDACGCKCVLWDLGGQEKMRPLWERYYSDCDAIIFVIDNTSSKQKFMEARRTFEYVYSNDELWNIPFLVFCNKMDDHNSLLDFGWDDEAFHDNEWIRFCAGSAKTGSGVRDAVEWVILAALAQIYQGKRLR